MSTFRAGAEAFGLHFHAGAKAPAYTHRAEAPASTYHLPPTTTHHPPTTNHQLLTTNY